MKCLFFASQALILFLAIGYYKTNGDTRSNDQNVRVCGHSIPTSYVLTSKQVVLPGEVHPAAVLVENGKITRIERFDADVEDLDQAASHVFGNGTTVYNHGNLTISPGLFDSHVHINDPGREDWEGFTTGTKTAVAGGTTSIILMPLNQHPTIVTHELFDNMIDVSKGKLWADVGFWGGIVPENAANHTVLQGMLDSGALGFKSFLSPSGIDDFGNVSEANVREALPFLKAKGLPYYVHAEIDEGLTIQVLRDDNATSYQPGFKIHVAHLSCPSCLDFIDEAKREGLPISVETCAHYLTFHSEMIPDGFTEFKCAPPLRNRRNAAALIQGVIDGRIDMVSSDHSPTLDENRLREQGNFGKSWGGISGLQFNLPATWTALREESGNVTQAFIAKIFSEWPANLAGVDDHKGFIREGYDADFVVWDPEATADTSLDNLYQKNKLTPYLDFPLTGHVIETYLRGNLVYSDANKIAPTACGSTILDRTNAK